MRKNILSKITTAAFILIFILIYSKTSVSQTNIFPSTGNVGIGTTSPDFKLHVIGSVLVGTTTTATYNSIIINGGNTHTPGSPNTNRIRFGGSDANANYFTIQGVADVDYLTINQGNVLIGKTSQANTSYKLDVNGNVRANKVVVNTTGADFVFDPTYHLPSFDSLENYIRTHHHLPDMPSAINMQQQGLDLGENQTCLLQKIEELTRYVIELNHRLLGQKEEIRRLKEQLGNERSR